MAIKGIAVTLEEFCERLNLDVIENGDINEIIITCPDIMRPGLHLAGYYDYYKDGCIHVMGETETGFLQKLSADERLEACRIFFERSFACLILSGVKPCKELTECAKEYGKVILSNRLRTTPTVNELSEYLNELFAPESMAMGSLLDIFGVGVLLMGESGIGKSESALELVQRGHRLVSDESILVKKINNKLIGSAPDRMHYMMEIRGIGMVNVGEMYGSGSIKLEQEIDFCIKLEDWNDERIYTVWDKAADNFELLGSFVPMVKLPIKPGRSVASIVEVAVKNFRLQYIAKRLNIEKPADNT